MKELLSIQSQLKAPKGQYNSFGKYKYRSAEDILEAVKPLLIENDCLMTITDDIVLVGDRYYIKATVTITNADGESVSNTAFARESETKTGMDASQITGTASSYARKYALNGLLLIDDTKDADTDEYHKRTTKKAEPKKAEPKPEPSLTFEQELEIEENINGCETEEQLKKLFNQLKKDYPNDMVDGAPLYNAAKRRTNEIRRANTNNNISLF